MRTHAKIPAANAIAPSHRQRGARTLRLGGASIVERRCSNRPKKQEEVQTNTKPLGRPALLQCGTQILTNKTRHDCPRRLSRPKRGLQDISFSFAIKHGRQVLSHLTQREGAAVGHNHTRRKAMCASTLQLSTRTTHPHVVCVSFAVSVSLLITLCTYSFRRLKPSRPPRDTRLYIPPRRTVHRISSVWCLSSVSLVRSRRSCMPLLPPVPVDTSQ